MCRLPKNGAEYFENAVDNRLRDLEHLEGESQALEASSLRFNLDRHASARGVQIFVERRASQVQRLAELLVVLALCHELIEHVVVSLAGALERNSRLLEQIILDDAAFYRVLGVEAHLHEFSKPRAVIVAHCLRISC